MLVKFNHWLETSKPGERIEYWRGDHLAGAPEGLARRAMQASSDRKVLLMLRKYKIGDFGFWAIRVSNECPAKMFPYQPDMGIKVLGLHRVQKRPARPNP
jgi:hypothetical protein